jgi:hypothetical protein
MGVGFYSGDRVASGAMRAGANRRVLWAIVFALAVAVGVLGAKVFVDGEAATGIVALGAAGVLCGFAANRFDRPRS